MGFVKMPTLAAHVSRPAKVALTVAFVALYPAICILHEAWVIQCERSYGYIRTEPKPRPITSRWRRRRALTNRDVKPPGDCSLLALPREVRDEIWRHVIGEPKVHAWISAVDSSRGLEGARCGEVCQHCSWHSVGYSTASTDKASDPTFGVMGCLLSCAQTYSEAIKLLYSMPSFDFANGSKIAYLPRVLLQQRINLIRTLNVTWRLEDPPSLPSPPRRSSDPDKMEKAKQKNHHYRETWVAVWQNLAAMEGLVDLKVELKIGSRKRRHIRHTRSHLWNASDLEIAKTVTRPRNFQLILPAELENRVREDVTAPNLRLVPSLNARGRF
ncbi:uncharacterized protein LY89DRAFT_180516 [Mollisia scopiformis]|uniref:DUF7730 domain-containing protein n=1 Tax=Mollisia scopiformis TaxID=149040 RepID=A0A194XUI8_MOLSC|nr:uncharacterized protein LY89DRAFT_180516 [Mollisia scopiformis]KUJ23372.1 hypothetical protein LY89DRAFT_180516 [Mollisia scopiformis]